MFSPTSPQKIAIGIGVVDIKVNRVESPDEIATRIEKTSKKAGPGRVRWVHPDCGFWMLKRSIADRKIEALVKGRNKFLGCGQIEICRGECGPAP